VPPEPPAKFFVNSGIVSGPSDIHNLLRPLLKQTVTYRYHRAGSIVSQGTGWVERVVHEEPEVSSFFTPLSICLNVDSWEHLEFETRPDQLVAYVLVQGDERVILEFAPVSGPAAEEARAEQQAFRFSTGDYVQMELSHLAPPPEGDDPAAGSPGS
jgi:hypothetical protein